MIESKATGVRVLNRPNRIGCALKQKDWGVFGLDQKVLNSSQGKPKRTNRECRMRYTYGSSSIQLLSKVFLAVVIIFSTASNANSDVGQSAEPLVQKQKSMKEQYRQVGDAYEAMMVKHLYGQLTSSQSMWIDKDSPFAPSNGEKIFKSMYDQLVMDNVAKRRPLGVSDLVVQQLEGKGGVRTQPRVNYNSRVTEVKDHSSQEQ